MKMNRLLSRIGYEWALWIVGRKWFGLKPIVTIELAVANWLMRRALVRDLRRVL